MSKELLGFNIRLKPETVLSDLVSLANEIYELFSPESILYEFTTDLKKIIYAEKLFNSFHEFTKFYSSRNYRFDLLQLKWLEKTTFVSFQQSRDNLRIFGSLNERKLFDQMISLSEKQILYGYIHNELDLILSKSNKERDWKRRLGKIPNHVKTFKNPRFGSGERNEYLIDLETVPTHQHLIRSGDKLWFGACAEMYFSAVYYNYIPERKWDNFKECIENRVLDSELRKVILYSNLHDFDNSNHRERQWKFRNVLGIDEIAHSLLKN